MTILKHLGEYSQIRKFCQLLALLTYSFSSYRCQKP
nr:MAG TPA: hypothetical protein [Caudoviricetes sp.]